jgi:uncharacterized protein (DUF4415 family)
MVSIQREGQEHMSEEHIVRYTADELAKMRARGESQTNWEKLDALTEDELEEVIASDPDSAIPPKDWQDAILGIPETPQTKKQMNFRIEADILRWFRAQGKDYQAKMNAVLRAYMLAQRTKRQ